MKHAIRDLQQRLDVTVEVSFLRDGDKVVTVRDALGRHGTARNRRSSVALRMAEACYRRAMKVH